MKKIITLAVPPSQGIDVIGPMEAFGIASRLVEEQTGCPGYQTELVTSDPKLEVMTSSGVRLAAHRHFKELRGKFDTLLISGGGGTRGPRNPELLAWLRKVSRQTRRMCSICTGAFLLADAGLLDGKRATTHWRFVASFARKYPAVTWDPNPIFIQDGNTFTSAGITAGMDLALALIEADYGSTLALDVARHMVIFLRRPGSQAQFSVAMTAQAAERRSLQDLQAWIAENLAKDLAVEVLAARVAMSTRNFARVFARELGSTPARYVEQVRIEAARSQLTTTADGVEQIASRCGFSSAELLRRCFLRHFKIAPSQYRQHFHSGQVVA